MEVASPIIKVPLNEAKELVKQLYLKGHRQSILWLGAPGIGKSEGIKQIAEELADIKRKEFEPIKFRFRGKKLLNYTTVYERAAAILSEPDRYFSFLDIRLTEFEPVDLMGVPRDFKLNIKDLEATLFDYQPFIWQLIASSTAGISLFDEVTNVNRPDLRTVMYKILRDRMTGWVEFHPDMLVMAAGNRPEDAAIASQLDAPVINRVLVMNILQPSVDDWAEKYMNKYVEDWDRRVYAFLKRFENFMFQKPQDVETLDPFPTPRSWTELAKISHKISEDHLEYVVYGEVGAEAASHFVTFVRTNVPDLSEVLAHPEKLAALDVDGKYLVASQVASQINAELTANPHKKTDVKPAVQKYVRLFTWLNQNDREILMLILTMCNNKIRVKLHATMLTIPALRPVAEFMKDSIKLAWDVGIDKTRR